MNGASWVAAQLFPRFRSFRGDPVPRFQLENGSTGYVSKQGGFRVQSVYEGWRIVYARAATACLRMSTYSGMTCDLEHFGVVHDKPLVFLFQGNQRTMALSRPASNLLEHGCIVLLTFAESRCSVESSSCHDRQRASNFPSVLFPKVSSRV